MEPNIIKSKSISIDQIKYLVSNHRVKPIENLLISDITFPSSLSSRRRQTESDSELVINVRLIFNSLSTENINQRSEQLEKIVMENAKSVEMINDIANEIFSHFLNDEKMIPCYLRLLNAVYRMGNCPIGMSIEELKKTNNGPTIGNHFLRKCRDIIVGMIAFKNIKILSDYDLDDVEELDKYNDQREKIFNLITTICYLYEQRNSPYIHLTALQLIPLMSSIIKCHAFAIDELSKTSNPYEDENCSDEDATKYESLRRMANIYAEQLYVFISREAKRFVEDNTCQGDLTCKSIVDIFKRQVVPTLTEAYMINKCKNIDY